MTGFQLKPGLTSQLALAICLLVSLWGCAQKPLSLQTASLPLSSIQTQGAAAEWRAINRLTYGPSPALLADLKSNGQPKNWALAQLDAARKASLEAPKLPPRLFCPALADCGLTLNHWSK